MRRKRGSVSPPPIADEILRGATVWRAGNFNVGAQAIAAAYLRQRVRTESG